MREWGRKPYISKSYHDMMKKVTNRAKWNQRLEKQSEFEKPYRDDNYAEMQHYHSKSNERRGDYPGMPVGGIPVEEGYNIVFMCTPSPCYCEGQTRCVDLGCTHPITHIDTSFCDPAITIALVGTKLCVTVPSGVNTGLCSITVWMEATESGGGLYHKWVPAINRKVMLLPEPVKGYHGFASISECDDCCDCDGISIGYTTQGMQVDEEQVLTVEGAAEGCTYTWAISSGGGELSAETGTSVTYTAPSTNANCASNPTITLSVAGQVCDTLEIAVNAYDYSGTVIYTYYDKECYKVSLATCFIWVNGYNCHGELSFGPCHIANSGSFGDKCPEPCETQLNYVMCESGRTPINTLEAQSPRWGAPGWPEVGCCPPQMLL